MGFFVVCDDTEREYGSDEKAANFYSEVEKQGWTPFSMAKLKRGIRPAQMTEIMIVRGKN